MFDFNKARRLLKKNAYDAVFKEAKKIVVAEFVFLYCPNQVGHARLGLAISKKAIAKAHDRNRIKRLLRETFRLRSGLPHVDVIVLMRGRVLAMQNLAIMAKLDKAWNILVNSCKE